MLIPIKRRWRLKLYGLKNCDACKKAFKELKKAGKSIDFIDIRESPVTSDQLRNLLSQHGESVLVNRKSTTWRNLNDVERLQPAFRLLQAHPKLIKRPVIVAGGDSYVGWTSDVKSALGLVKT